MSATHSRSGAVALKLRRTRSGAGALVSSRTGRPHEAPPMDALELGRAHQPGDPLAADPPVVLEAQLGLDPRCPVRPPAALVDLADPGGQGGIGSSPCRWRPVRPGPVAARGDARTRHIVVTGKLAFSRSTKRNTITGFRRSPGRRRPRLFSGSRARSAGSGSRGATG